MRPRLFTRPVIIIIHVSCAFDCEDFGVGVVRPREVVAAGAGYDILWFLGKFGNEGGVAHYVDTAALLGVAIAPACEDVAVNGGGADVANCFSLSVAVGQCNIVIHFRERTILACRNADLVGGGCIEEGSDDGVGSDGDSALVVGNAIAPSEPCAAVHIILIEIDGQAFANGDVYLRIIAEPRFTCASPIIDILIVAANAIAAEGNGVGRSWLELCLEGGVLRQGEGTRVVSVAIAPFGELVEIVCYCLDISGVGIAVGGGDICLAAIGSREVEGMA